MEGQYERVSQSRKLLYSVPAALCEEIARAATAELAERAFRTRPFWSNPRGLEQVHLFRVFAWFFLRCPSAPKMVKRDTGPFFVICVAVSLNFKSGKNDAEWHRAFFCHFCGAATCSQKKRR